MPVKAVGEVLSVAVNAPPPPEVSEAVYTTVAFPFESVVEVADENVPPTALVDHVTILPETATELPDESWSCAVTVTAPPAAGVDVESVTPYLVALAAGVTEFDAEDAGPVPLAFVAVTVKL